MSEPFYLNVSSIQDFSQCRWRWVARWVCNREPRGPARALSFGKLLHEIFEDHLGDGLPMETAIAQQRTRLVELLVGGRLEPLEERVAAEALMDLDTYREVLCMWRDNYPIEPALEVEQPFEIPHPLDASIIIRGRPDRVAPLWGRLYHIQNRGLAATTNFALYCELAKRHLHEHVYAYAITQKYPDTPYGGTVMNLLRKLKYRGKPTKVHPEGKILHTPQELMWQGMVEIKPERTKEMMLNVYYWATEMQRVKAAYENVGIWPAPNERMNAGYFGNTIDPYFRVLEGEVSLDDDTLFQTREDTYASAE